MSSIKLEINGKKIFIVENHQEVLLYWYEHFIEIGSKLELISFDYHADTIIGFRDFAWRKAREKNEHLANDYFDDIRLDTVKKLRENMSIKTISECINILNCDEQIMTAYEMEIINKYQVIYCQDNYEEFGGKHLKNRIISCEGHNNPSKECYKHCSDINISYCHRRLEDEYLSKVQINEIKGKYILDIDLDYFQTIDALRPQEFSIFAELVEKAEIITIARSQEYFDHLKIDDFTTEVAEQYLIELLKKILH